MINRYRCSALKVVPWPKRHQNRFRLLISNTHVVHQCILQAGTSTTNTTTTLSILTPTEQTAATEKSCYVCYKPTPIVLATANTVDFVYSCESHLSDRNFASELEGDNTPKKVVSPDEIDKVKLEWEAKEKARKEKEKEKQERAKEDKEKDKDKDKDEKDKDKDKETKSPKPTSPAPPAPSSPPPTQSHKKYALHRDFYASKCCAMTPCQCSFLTPLISVRQNEHKKRRLTTQAKALAPRLPGVPTSTLR